MVNERTATNLVPGWSSIHLVVPYHGHVYGDMLFPNNERKDQYVVNCVNYLWQCAVCCLCFLSFCESNVIICHAFFSSWHVSLCFSCILGWSSWCCGCYLRLLAQNLTKLFLHGVSMFSMCLHVLLCFLFFSQVLWLPSSVHEYVLYFRFIVDV